MLKLDTAEGPAVKCGHRQRSLPGAAGGRILVQDRSVPRVAKYNRLLEIAAAAPGLRYGMS
jgi:hypothetical protein